MAAIQKSLDLLRSTSFVHTGRLSQKRENGNLLLQKDFRISAESKDFCLQIKFAVLRPVWTDVEPAEKPICFVIDLLLCFYLSELWYLNVVNVYI